MKRRRFNHLAGGAAAVSLVLCAAAVVAWVLSYRSESWAGYSERTVGPRNWDSRYVRIVSSKGALWLADLGMLTPPWQQLPQGWVFHWNAKELRGGRVLVSVEQWLPSARCFRLFGIVICTKPFPVAAVPYWLLTTTLAVLPVAWGMDRRRRKPSGRCAICGYDLRESPDRCPECGTVREAAV